MVRESSPSCVLLAVPRHQEVGPSASSTKVFHYERVHGTVCTAQCLGHPFEGGSGTTPAVNAKT